MSSESPEVRRGAEPSVVEREVISAELSIGAKGARMPELDDIDRALRQIDSELERYANRADRLDYALAIGSGILAGIIDSAFAGEFSLDEANQWGSEKANDIVRKVARSQGYEGDSLPGAIQFLERKFPIAADKATSQLGGARQHHLRDFTHHPTPIGLICSILTQFTDNGKVYGADDAGAFIPVELKDDSLELIGKTVPEKLFFGVVNWALHLVSDMAGSSGSATRDSLGTGIPGPIVATLKELAATPLFQKMDGEGHRAFSVWISKLFNGTLLNERDADGKLTSRKFDLRTEIGIGHQLARQQLPVCVNECTVRALYFLRRLAMELERVRPESVAELEALNWSEILPRRNRALERMQAVASVTFFLADAADAAMRAAIESGGNYVLFAGRFAARVNYLGAGRAAVAIVREFSAEQREAQLLHEKALLSEEKAALVLEQLQQYKARLAELVSNYLAEDIAAFLSGFDFMERGFAAGDAELVIRGNVIIQRVLGREPQFTNRAEFDALMASDESLTL